MVRLIGCFLVLLELSCCASAGQQPQQRQGTQPPAVPDLAEMANELAHTVFVEADTNRNQWLSRNEAPNAVDRLDEAMERWGVQGVLGRPRKQNRKQDDEATDPLATVANLTGRLLKNPRISEPEFTLYVQNVVQQADDHWRRLRAMSEAQRKAYNAYRAALRPRRGRIVTGYPVPSY